MPQTPPITSLADAAATIPVNTSGEARELERIVQQILNMPGGPQYLERTLRENNFPGGSRSADDINAALDECVAHNPVLRDYLAQLREMAALSPAAQANPDALLPRMSLEALDLEPPHPDATVCQPNNPETLVDRLRNAGL